MENSLSGGGKNGAGAGAHKGLPPKIAVHNHFCSALLSSRNKITLSPRDSRSVMLDLRKI
jgi:hypothetical protein